VVLTSQRLPLPEARRDTAATAESARCSARAVRAEGSRRPAARARRWTTSRASGNAMASSSQRRIRAKRNTHILCVPSSSGPWPAPAAVPGDLGCPCRSARPVSVLRPAVLPVRIGVLRSARRYPPSSAVITGRVRLIRRRCSAALVTTAGLTAAKTRSLAALGTGSVASRRCGADAEGALDGSWPTRTMTEREPSPVHEDHVVTDILASAAHGYPVPRQPPGADPPGAGAPAGA
jgi:hypothetical protein